MDETLMQNDRINAFDRKDFSARERRRALRRGLTQISVNLGRWGVEYQILDSNSASE
jgi:hypothetical protein